MRGFLGGAATYTAANVASGLVPFLLLPALTRAMSPDDYGRVAMFATLLAVVSPLVGLSVVGSVSVRYFELKEGFSVYVTSCLAVMLASLVAVAILVLAVWAIRPDALGLPLSWLLAAVGSAAASFVLQLRLMVWLAQRKALAYAGLQVSYAVLNAGLTVLLVLVIEGGASGRMGAQALALAGAAALALISLGRSRMLVPRISLPYMDEAIRFGMPLVPHVLGSIMIVSFDRFIINESQGLAQTGIYMVAVQIAMVVALMADAVNKAFVPWLYSRLGEGQAGFRPWMVRKTWLCFLVIGVLTGALALLVRPLIGFVAGERYMEASSVLPWLLAGQAFGAAYLLVVNYIFYAKRTYYLAATSVACGLGNVLLTLVLVPRLGILGAGIAFFCTQALQFALVWWCSNRAFPMPWFSWRREAAFS